VNGAAAPSHVFIDTHALIAIINADDTHHAAAFEAFASLEESRSRVFTSDWVLGEFLSLAAPRRTRSAAVRAVEELRKAPLTMILEASREDWVRAYKLFRQRRDKDWSFIDCTSMVLCKDLGIDHVLTHDHHFTQAGLTILLR
jgi:predicted nucleic acid-binding protein